MIRDLATNHADILTSAIVFGITFFLFIGWLAWCGIVSKKYINHCKGMTQDDK